MEKKELIVVKQLPIIEEQLKSLSNEIDDKINKALSLKVSEDSVKEIKKARAELNNDFKELENQRKMVKEKVLAPYNQFEEIYKTYVSEKFKDADKELKSKIDGIENDLKHQKELEVHSYFVEYAQSLQLEWLNEEQKYYTMANINVTLSASMKSLKESAKNFIDKIDSDLKLIDTQEHKEEIIIEYKKELNVSKAITDVSDRYKQLEIIKQQEEKKKEIKQQEEQKSEEIKELIVEPPKEIKQEKIYELNFKVYGTKEQLVLLKQFLENGGYRYE
jgi:hypothetical protein